MRRIMLQPAGFGRTAYMLAYTVIAGDYPVLEANVEDPRDAGAAAGTGGASPANTTVAS